MHNINHCVGGLDILKANRSNFALPVGVPTDLIPHTTLSHDFSMTFGSTLRKESRIIFILNFSHELY